MRPNPTRKALLVGLSLGMLIGVAGTVLAAHPKLDEASSHAVAAMAAGLTKVAVPSGLAPW